MTRRPRLWEETSRLPVSCRGVFGGRAQKNASRQRRERRSLPFRIQRTIPTEPMVQVHIKPTGNKILAPKKIIFRIKFSVVCTSSSLLLLFDPPKFCQNENTQIILSTTNFVCAHTRFTPSYFFPPANRINGFVVVAVIATLIIIVDENLSFSSRDKKGNLPADKTVERISIFGGCRDPKLI